ncbi:MAG TPA: tetratricopeptide repeat protein [Terriglobales bacterium]|nr:tetratricopeptide repeat protein [Terriglobales bacterium]
MRVKIVAVLFLLTANLSAQDHTQKIVDCEQLLSWMTAGVPNQRISRLVRERGTNFHINSDITQLLSSAGTGGDVPNQWARANVVGRKASCPADLLQAAHLVHQKNFDEAQTIVEKRLAAEPDNADLHMALAYIRLEQGDLDEAFDGYSDAKDLDATFPEIHNGLSYIFYRSNDAENAIAEARTALSIDPKNAEAYRYLALGHYLNENYPAALHAVQESLTRDPNCAETFYDKGLIQVAQQNLAGSAESYQRALQLNPGLIEAQAGLRLVRREIQQPTAALRGPRKSQSNTAQRQ